MNAITQNKKYYVVTRIGTKLGMHGYCHRIWISIECRRPDGTRVMYPTEGGGHTPYLHTWGWFAEHYKSGMSKHVQSLFDDAKKEAEQLASRYNYEN